MESSANLDVEFGLQGFGRQLVDGFDDVHAGEVAGGVLGRGPALQDVC